jgi:hypothetical protein
VRAREGLLQQGAGGAADARGWLCWLLDCNWGSRGPWGPRGAAGATRIAAPGSWHAQGATKRAGEVASTSRSRLRPPGRRAGGEVSLARVGASLGEEEERSGWERVRLCVARRAARDVYVPRARALLPPSDASEGRAQSADGSAAPRVAKAPPARPRTLRLYLHDRVCFWTAPKLRHRPTVAPLADRSPWPERSPSAWCLSCPATPGREPRSRTRRAPPHTAASCTRARRTSSSTAAARRSSSTGTAAARRQSCTRPSMPAPPRASVRCDALRALSPRPRRASLAPGSRDHASARPLPAASCQRRLASRPPAPPSSRPPYRAGTYAFHEWILQAADESFGIHWTGGLGGAGG